MEFAPILIPTLNRHAHLQRCVRSLTSCTYSEKTDLFIALDFPYNDSVVDGYRIVSSYVRSIRGFRTVNIIEREKNFGAFQNFISARDEMFTVYETLIASDDDNEFSLNFLEYINKGLQTFHDAPRIIAVCGDGGTFTKPVDYAANFIYRKGFSAWGYGTWKDRLGKLEYTSEELYDFVRDKSLRNKLKYYYERHYYSVLAHISSGRTMYGDGAIALNMIKDDTFAVYPTVSKVRNHGHDGSGVHGGDLKDSPFEKVVIDSSEHFDYEGDPDFDDPIDLEQLRSYSRLTSQQKMKFWLRKAKNPKNMFDLLKIIL